MTTSAEIAAEAVDACYAVFGIAAIYTPPGGGSPVDCVIIKDAQDRRVAGGLGRAMMKGVIMKVRSAEITQPARGGTFAIIETSESFEVLSDPETPEDDPERL